MQVLIPVSIGELVDKITDLQIKASRLESSPCCSHRSAQESLQVR